MAFRLPNQPMILYKHNWMQSAFEDVVIWFQSTVKIVILSKLIHSLNKNLGFILRLTNIYKYNLKGVHHEFGCTC